MPIKKIHERIKKNLNNVRSHEFVWMFAILNLVLFSHPFMNAIYNAKQSFVFTFCTFIIAFLYFNLIFSLLFYKKTTKILSVIILLTNASVLYFINTYNVFVDLSMVRNVLETDSKETLELLNFRFFLYIIFLGVIPSYFVYKIKIHHQYFLKEFKHRFLNIFLSLLVVLVVLAFNYRTISSFVRAEKQLQYLLIPTNYMTSSSDLVRRKIRAAAKNTEVKPIGEDAVLDENFYKNSQKKNLLILVVGEAARAQEFSLNGYERDTNSPLEKYNDLINFTNVSSCGTATAVSVPCMFSYLDRKHFDVEKKDEYWNVEDIFKKLNFGLLWRDNNSGCKGVCKNFESEGYYKVREDSKYCNKEECFDDAMLEGLDQKLKKMDSNNIIITLHQKGSHGPDYYKRTPEELWKFQPVCQSEYFDKCTHEELVNAYDNTIYYTSLFLSHVIDFLKENSKEYNTAMIYLSDHGQSLGENGLYLHGAPYFVAPKEQTHIPFIVWLSDDFANNFKIDRQCLIKKEDAELSQDNLYHSLLGLFKVKTSAYDKQLDLFNGCAE
jgi:lipid A ethanolaminephosphotransferase